MTQISRPWNGTTEGDCGPYSADQWKQIWETLFMADPTVEGVVLGYGGELQVTDSGANSVAVATGAALVKGCWYENDASASFTISTPSGATRYDRIVLRCVWSGTGTYPQTVRLRKLTGTEGGGVPSLTQSDGATWEIPLCTVQMTVGGVKTLTDERTFLRAGFSHENVHYTGDLTPVRSSTEYTAYAVVSYGKTPKTSTSYDGDDTVTPGTHTLDMSALFGTPADAAGYLIQTSAKWAAASDSSRLGIRPKGQAASLNTVGLVATVANMTQVNTGWVPAGDDNDLELYVANANATEVVIRVWAIWL